MGAYSEGFCRPAYMPALCMGHRDPPERLRQFSIVSGSEQEMPVIRHQAIGGDAQSCLGADLRPHLFKSRVVHRLLKQRQSPKAAVQHMIDEIASGQGGTTGHADSCSAIGCFVRKGSRPPFSRPPFSWTKEPQGWFAVQRCASIPPVTTISRGYPSILAGTRWRADSSRR